MGNFGYTKLLRLVDCQSNQIQTRKTQSLKQTDSIELSGRCLIVRNDLCCTIYSTQSGKQKNQFLVISDLCVFESKSLIKTFGSGKNEAYLERSAEQPAQNDQRWAITKLALIN